MLGSFSHVNDGTVPLAMPGNPQEYLSAVQLASPQVAIDDLFRFMYRASAIAVSVQFSGNLNPDAGTGFARVFGQAQKTCRRSGSFLFTDDIERPEPAPTWKRIGFSVFPTIEMTVPSVAVDDEDVETSYDTSIQVLCAPGSLPAPFFSEKKGVYIIENLNFSITGLASWDNTDVSGSFLGSAFRFKKDSDASLFLSRFASLNISFSGGDLPLL